MNGDGCPFDVAPLGNGIAMEIRDVDVRRVRSQGDLAAIEKLVAEHHVLLFRGQTLTEDEQGDFTRAFGDDSRPLLYGQENNFKIPSIETPTRGESRHRGKRAVYITYGPDHFESGFENSLFHSDTSWMKTPLCYTFLYAVEAPAAGGYTQFASQALAYDALSADVKRRVDALQAIFSLPMARKQDGGDGVGTLHPVVREHPITGRRSLFVNRAHTERISDMDPAESELLLSHMFTSPRSPAARGLIVGRQGTC